MYINIFLGNIINYILFIDYYRENSIYQKLIITEIFINIIMLFSSVNLRSSDLSQNFLIHISIILQYLLVIIYQVNMNIFYKNENIFGILIFFLNQVFLLYNKVNYFNKIKYCLNKKKNYCCSICLNNIDIYMYCYNLECNHSFHIECLDEWLLYKKNCPNCRKDLSIV